MQEKSLREALNSDSFPEVTVSYFSHGYPTFSLPPKDINQLRLFHGSCRQIGDRDLDALPILDLAIAETAHRPDDRPHQLFMTGDQIYGDDLSQPLLWGIQVNCDRLFDWTDALDIDPLIRQKGDKFPKDRTRLARDLAGFTASLKNSPEKSKSHLFRFQEYCVIYLLSWSQCCWDIDFPTASERGLKGKEARKWTAEVNNLHQFKASQPYVRRALANIATYMIFDDHDVSNDWNLNKTWCDRVYGKLLGRQVVRNALLTYALFQGWGNTPNQFSKGTIGEELITQTERWSQSGGANHKATKNIYELLGLPFIDSSEQPKFIRDGNCFCLYHASPCLQWHYRIETTNYEVIALDTRTQRGYPAGDSNAIPQLLSPSAFEEQLGAMLDPKNSDRPDNFLTFVIAPTNVFSLELLRTAQRFSQRLGRVFDADVGDSWNLEEETRAEFLASLFRNRDRIVILTGDIHFSAALQLTYESDHQKHPKSLIQLTASAISNSDTATAFLHTIFKSFFPERERHWHRNNVHYSTHWISRSPAKSLSWGDRIPWLLDNLKNPNASLIIKWFQRALLYFWTRRWIQEGKEVIGLNNLAEVSVESNHTHNGSNGSFVDSYLSVSQLVYWYTTWDSGKIVRSEFNGFRNKKIVGQPVRKEPAAQKLGGKRQRLG